MSSEETTTASSQAAETLENEVLDEAGTGGAVDTSKQYYYSIAYGYDYITIAVPFLFALAVFYLTYFTMFKLVSHRIRAKRLVAR